MQRQINVIDRQINVIDRQINVIDRPINVIDRPIHWFQLLGETCVRTTILIGFHDHFAIHI